MNMGQKIRYARKQRKLTMEDLAGLSGCTKGYIWDLEFSKSTNPSAKKLYRISLALDVPFEYIVDDDIKVVNDMLKWKPFYGRFKMLSDIDKSKVINIMDRYL